MMKCDNGVEVIEDSEPERQQQREALYEQRRKDRPGTMYIPAQDDPPIIEISDDESLHGSRPATIIELSDDSGSFHGLCLSTSSRAKPGLPPKSLSITTSESHEGSESQYKSQTISNACTTTTTYKDSLSPSQSNSLESHVLDLERFGFISTRPSGPSTSSSSITFPSHQPTPLTRIPSKTVRRPHVHDYSFTDSQLQKLTRCVCCQIPWTTRKSASGKLNHIQKCARKNCLTEEAVRLMIEKDLQALAVQGDLKKGRGKPVAPEQATLLGTVVADTNTKTKGRKKDVPITVLQVAETHQAIYSRAKALFDESEDSDTSRFPATQGFAPSKLGRNIQLQPEATQSLQKSRLGTNHRVPGFGGSDDDEVSSSRPPSPAHGSPPLSPRSPSPQNSIYLPPSSERFRAKGKHLTLRGELRQSLSRHSGAEDELQNELDRSFGETPSDIIDSCGHWDAGVTGWDRPGAEENATPKLWPSASFSPRTSATELATPSTRRLSPHFDVLRMNYSTQSSLPLPFGRPISPRRRSPTRKKRPRKAKIVTTTEGRASPGVALQSAADDDLFEVVMLTAIKANTELYHKVLRYEPVDFNVFLNLAVGRDLPTKNLVYKLRAFLDQQTIHSCGPSESRTARY